MSSFEITLSAKVHVFCGHGRQKREVVDLAFDAATEKPHLCPCCENLYTKRDDIPGYCTTCQGAVVTPHWKPGVKHGSNLS